MERYKKFEGILLGSYFTKIESFYKNNATDICVILAGYIESVEREQDTRFSDVEAEELVARIVRTLFPEVALCKHQRLVKISLEVITSYRAHILVNQEGNLFPIGQIVDRCGYFENILIKTHSIEIGSFYKGKVPETYAFLGACIAKAESEFDKVFSDVEAEQLVAHIVCILFPEEPYCKHFREHQRFVNISLAVVNNYGANVSIDLGGQQTPCTFDETLLQKRLATSTTTARSGVKSILKSLGLKKVFNYLINEMKSLISRRCE